MNVYLVKWVRKTYGQQLIKAASEDEAKERLRKLDKADLLDFDEDGNDIHEDGWAEAEGIKVATRGVLLEAIQDPTIDRVLRAELGDDFVDALTTADEVNLDEFTDALGDHEAGQEQRREEAEEEERLYKAALAGKVRPRLRPGDIYKGKVITEADLVNGKEA